MEFSNMMETDKLRQHDKWSVHYTLTKQYIFNNTILKVEIRY